MSPPPGSLGQSMTGSMMPLRPQIGPLPGRVTPMGGSLRGPLPSIGMKVQPPAGQAIGQPMPSIGHTELGQDTAGKVITAEPAMQVGQDSVGKEQKGNEASHGEDETMGEK